MVPGIPGDKRVWRNDAGGTETVISEGSPFFGRGLHPGSTFEASGAVAAGKISHEELREVNSRNCCSLCAAHMYT